MFLPLFYMRSHNRWTQIKYGLSVLNPIKTTDKFNGVSWNILLDSFTKTVELVQSWFTIYFIQTNSCTLFKTHSHL